ncbi:MAG: hypothetical protein C0423_01880 [Methylibium sp.]|nr:hypothetical protein [Methylibium sp.]
MNVEISFDNESAVVNIPLADWAPPLVEYVGRYFDIREGVLRLDYAHLSAEQCSDLRRSIWSWKTYLEHFVYEFEAAARQGPIALTVAILGHGSTRIEESSSILDREAYRSAEKTFKMDVLHGDNPALREAILAEITPRATWVNWLLEANSYRRDDFLNDQEIMAALVARTSESDCIHGLELVKPNRDESFWAFDQLVKKHWRHVLDYVKCHIGKAPSYSGSEVPHLVYALFSRSPTVQLSREACEQVLDRAHPTVFSQLIQYCRTLVADDVRRLLLSWHASAKTRMDDSFKDCVAKACSTLASLLADAMPSDIALATAWHEFGNPGRSDQQSVAACLRELPHASRDREVLWNQLGPAAREAWRQDLFDQVKAEPALARGLMEFACLWLEQTAFAEVEPVLLRLMDDEDYLAFANRLARDGPRQVQLRAGGLVRSIQGALDLDGPAGLGEDATALPSVGAQTWLGDPSVERVIHRALSQIEEEFCREYPATWGEDEEVHTAHLLALTQKAVGNATSQLHQLSATTRTQYPSLTVGVRQPTKREEGASTPAGAPLGADLLFLTRIVDQGRTVIQRATLVQVKKRRGNVSGRSFSSTIGINLQQCEDMLKQSEHAYYLFATPASPRPSLWVAPARLVRNLTQLHSSKASVGVIQVRDASRSFADFFLHDLVGLWAGDEQEGLVAVANGDPRLGRRPRHIVDIEVRLKSD